MADVERRKRHHPDSHTSAAGPAGRRREGKTSKGSVRRGRGREGDALWHEKIHLFRPGSGGP